MLPESPVSLAPEPEPASLLEAPELPLLPEAVDDPELPALDAEELALMAGPLEDIEALPDADPELELAEY